MSAMKTDALESQSPDGSRPEVQSSASLSHGGEGRAPQVRRVLWGGLGGTLCVAALKGAAGVLSGSAALLADAVHSAFDAANNILGLTAMGVASQPPDDDHPYGHHKAEVAAALLVGVGILYGAVEMGRHVFSAILSNGHAPEISPWTWAAALVGLVSSALLARFEASEGERLDSELLRADAADTRCDAWTTLAALVGMGLSSVGFAAADILAALIVMGMVAFTGASIIRRGFGVLMDQSRLDADEVKAVAHQVPGLLSCHDVRSRGMRGHVHLDLHVTFCPETTLAEAGERMLLLKRLLHSHFVDVQDIVVQLEPHLPHHLPAPSPIHVPDKNREPSRSLVVH